MAPILLFWVKQRYVFGYVPHILHGELASEEDTLFKLDLDTRIARQPMCGMEGKGKGVEVPCWLDVTFKDRRFQGSRVSRRITYFKQLVDVDIMLNAYSAFCA